MPFWAFSLLGDIRMVYYCGMAEAVKQILKYKSKKKVHQAVTSALEGHLTPTPVVETTTPVVVKRGSKPDVVKNFDTDMRSMDMAVYIGQGLGIEEAGILAKFSPEELAQLQERSEAYRLFVELQVIKFKQKHLKVISDKENPLTSQWLLEQKFPDVFGKRAKESNAGGVGSTQIIQAIIKSVQMTNDNLVVHEHEDYSQEKESKHNGTHITQGDNPSLEPGGANIL
jgi:hypothetical protein